MSEHELSNPLPGDDSMDDMKRRIILDAIAEIERLRDMLVSAASIITDAEEAHGTFDTDNWTEKEITKRWEWWREYWTHVDPIPRDEWPEEYQGADWRDTDDANNAVCEFSDDSDGRDCGHAECPACLHSRGRRRGALMSWYELKRQFIDSAARTLWAGAWGDERRAVASAGSGVARVSSTRRGAC